MKVVHLVRHAKSSWKDASLPDRERPLAPRGRRAARSLGEYLKGSRFSADLVLCSPAVRSRQTLELLREGLGEDLETLVEEGLYGASSDVLLERLRRLPATVGSVLVIGHNPGLQELAATLARGGARLDRVRDRFPTGALATLALASGRWADLGPASAELTAYVEPREL